MISRKSSSQLSTSSSGSGSSKKSHNSPATSILEVDMDDKDVAADEHAVPRPLRVAIPTDISGPYCPRRPALREILANTSPPPWTLAAFMAYLSNNHCLETLEFTMDAGRYRKHYTKMLSRATDGLPPTKDREYVQALWQRLVDAYIRPNGSREVNIPADVRDPILRLQSDTLPPAPDKLDSAVAKIYELMEDSVLVPFLNSAYPEDPAPTVGSYPYDSSTDRGSMTAGAYEDRSPFAKRSQRARSSPPPQSAVEPHAHSYSAPSYVSRKSISSMSTVPLNKARFSTKLSPTTSTPSTLVAETASGTSEANLSTTGSASGSGMGMTDDSGSTNSPVNESPKTPPTSPPVSDASPKRDSGMLGWKKLGRLGGMKGGKKRSQSGSEQ